MQRECRNGHPIPVRGLLRITWCAECDRYELHAWAVSTEAADFINLLPEWSGGVLLPDDEWRDRTLTRYVTGLTQTVRTLADDEAAGRLRLL